MLKVGLQLYTVRDELELDFKGTLAKVAELGYQGVEFHNFYGHSPEEVRAILDEFSLEIVGTHVQYNSLLEDLDGVIAYHKAIGNRNLIVPYLSEEQRQWDNVFASMNEIGEKCAAQDMVLMYHNHDFEFTEQVEGQPALYAMYDTVTASHLQVELDSCWAHAAGYPPTEVIAKYAGRLPLVHWKDMRRSEGQVLTVEFGQGEIDLGAVATASDQAGAEWLVVEQDVCQNPPLQSIESSMNWIRKYAANGGLVHV
ncbi:sugar phosphate isomerase/epimerase family protein [Paenibacillus xylanivorans]|uniref:Sugar phosphate isomerase n=1 Tax=Paenibacillus xylanivorans TaxID=1705561 RepID=A0A0N0C2D9_9BACL|nr:sugar phosphate isomerase/epimerase family protein [Paenibacillus xylanivorans]KOY12755.1 sugar phosphate isomerase [Paenibacillus xylanivorans]